MSMQGMDAHEVPGMDGPWHQAAPSPHLISRHRAVRPQISPDLGGLWEGRELLPSQS